MIVSAVIDALSPLGVRHVDMPLTSEKVWRLISRQRVLIGEVIQWRSYS